MKNITYREPQHEMRSALIKIALEASRPITSAPSTGVANGNSGGGFAGKMQNVGDRIGGAIGSFYQRVLDARRAGKREKALNGEAMDAYNKGWQQFAPTYTFDNFRRFKSKYVLDKMRMAATRGKTGVR